ncbi:hypothetical protein N7478_007272 [Penicillium angulare]|uniref:uncharacterized protein n=1 Tax=Penicillium angulare TaxID=116970 RepID=UPI00253FDAE2|nr:uncharacterized protein N7478_007272 [Penicillium angulare]KAJ5281900.1 hypothetical protein N7478_007272 [Penicillium angulare]
MRHFDAWVVRDPYSIWHYYSTGRRWQDTVRTLIQERKICSPSQEPETEPTNTKPINPQSTSPLLSQLPPEIRQMIWGYVFGSKTIHLVTVKDKIRHVACPQSNPSLTQHRHCCPYTPARWRIYDGRVPGHSDRLLYPHTHDLLPDHLSNSGNALLQTCQGINLEASDLLYQQSNFDVDDLYTFIAFASAIGTQKLNCIRQLTVQWMPVWQPFTGKDHKGSIYAHTHSDALWSEFWSVVSSMRGLRELQLSIDLGRFTGTQIGGGPVIVAGQRIPLVLSEGWLLPLLNVRGLKGFELAVTARCDAAAKGVIEEELVRDAVVLRDQLRAVMCSPVGMSIGGILGLGLKEWACALEALRERGEGEELLLQQSRRNGARLAITAA